MCLSRIFIPVAGSWPSGSGRIVLPPWPPTEWSKPAHHHLGILTGPAWMEVGWRLEGEFDGPPAASSASCSFIPCCCGQVVIVLALECPLAAACPWILLSAGYLSVYRVPSPQGLELTAVAGGTLRRICTMSKASVRASTGQQDGQKATATLFVNHCANYREPPCLPAEVTATERRRLPRFWQRLTVSSVSSF